ncbi:hypothetical protein Catovirus_1_625 [Catovirus CTV1]|uniref:Uncharacterized protein n=1 Tax=Catovirus CTV1 TaxID=1977631 RepID=A0A1V0SA33_9VIRU|nr:hypothetical protein Catovirus_1_625 [Catovirus CTV1]
MSINLNNTVEESYDNSEEKKSVLEDDDCESYYSEDFDRHHYKKELENKILELNNDYTCFTPYKDEENDDDCDTFSVSTCDSRTLEENLYGDGNDTEEEWDNSCDCRGGCALCGDFGD